MHLSELIAEASTLGVRNHSVTDYAGRTRYYEEDTYRDVVKVRIADDVDLDYELDDQGRCWLPGEGDIRATMISMVPVAGGLEVNFKIGEA